MDRDHIQPPKNFVNGLFHARLIFISKKNKKSQKCGADHNPSSGLQNAQTQKVLERSLRVWRGSMPWRTLSRRNPDACRKIPPRRIRSGPYISLGGWFWCVVEPNQSYVSNHARLLCIFLRFMACAFLVGLADASILAMVITSLIGFSSRRNRIFFPSSAPTEMATWHYF